MAVVGPMGRTNGSTSVSMNGSSRSHSIGMSSNGMSSHGHNQHNAILAAAQPFYSNNNCVNIQDIQPDRPIGYGAFGVVWYVFFSFLIYSLLPVKVRVLLQVRL